MRNANLGIGFGVLGGGVGAMLSMSGSGWLGLVVLLTGLGLGTWGLVQYTMSKAAQAQPRRHPPILAAGAAMAILFGTAVWGLQSVFTQQGRRLMPREQVSAVLGTMSAPQRTLGRLCEEGRLVPGMAPEAMGLLPRIRPEPGQAVDEISIRLEPPLRVVVQATLPEFRSHSFLPPDFEQVTLPKGTTLTLFGDCMGRNMSWSLDAASTTVPLKYLPGNLRPRS